MLLDPPRDRTFKHSPTDLIKFAASRRILGLIFLGFHQILGLQNKPNVPSLDRLNAHY